MKQNHYALGLDIGVTSVGYGVIDLDTGEAVDYGVRLFDESNPKDNQDRRTKRSGRRLKSRRRNRLDDARVLFEKEGLVSKNYKFGENPYEARVKGLHEKLSNEELATALYHLIKLRGSSLETVEDDSAAEADAEKAKAALGANDAELRKGKYVCEVQMERADTSGKIRGHINNFRTADYVKEAEQILSNQKVSEEFRKQVLALITRRRDFSEGPGSQISPTPYGRWLTAGQEEPINLIEKMRGHCSVYPSELRAAKMSYRADLFNILNDFNNLVIDQNGKITPEQKQELLALIDKKGTVTIKELSKVLGVEPERISGFRLDSKSRPILTEFKGYKAVMKVLKESGAYEDHELVNNIIEELTKDKAIERRKESLKKLSARLSGEEIDALANLGGISGYHSLSAKALDEFNEIMLDSTSNQMQILQSMLKEDDHLDRLRGKKNIEADDEAILSPVAKRAQREAMKVVNRLRELHGEFDSIVVETTRAKNTQDEKNMIRDRQAFFEQQNKRAENLLNEHHSNAKLNGKLRMKLRLYEEQQGKTGYAVLPIDLDLLISDPTAYEIDHILPISVSLDDSFSNKVLVTRWENQAKGNLSPLQAYEKGKFGEADINSYIAFVKECRQANGRRYEKKLNNLLFEEDMTKFTNMKNFINRNLVDTAYAERVVLNTMQDYFKANGIPTKVHTVKGSATHMFRSKVKIEKDRDDLETGYAHHAIDALIIASLKKFPRLSYLLDKYEDQELYNKETGEVSQIISDDEYFDPKYIQLVAKLMSLEKDVVKFSYKIDTKPNRQIADETIYSTRIYNDNEYVVKKYKNIYDPKQLNIANDILSGNVDKYLMKRNSPETFAYISEVVNHYAEEYRKDTKVFDAGKNQFKINPLSMYYEENGKLRKPSKKGNGPEITMMKYTDGQLGNYIDVTGKYEDYKPKNKRVVLQQISPYRTDFYYSEENGYRFVTVRYSNVHFSKAKNCYVIDPQWYEEQKVLKKIDDSFEFCFSMHHDELFEMTMDGEEKATMWKFTATNNDMTNRIEVKPRGYYEKQRIMKTIGVKVAKLEKYATDVCGNLYKVTGQKLKLELK